MIYDNRLDAMGHTPLIRLNRLVEENAAQILVKFEALLVVLLRRGLHII